MPLETIQNNQQNNQQNNIQDNIKDNMYFINVNFNGMTGLKHIYSKNDYDTIEELYKTCNEYGHPIIYNLIHKLILNVPKTKK